MEYTFKLLFCLVEPFKSYEITNNTVEFVQRLSAKGSQKASRLIDLEYFKLIPC